MDNNINEIIQYTLVAIIVALAIIWLLKKIFTTKKNKTKTLSDLTENFKKIFLLKFFIINGNKRKCLASAKKRKKTANNIELWFLIQQA